MINFTVGPVQMFDETLALGAEQIPYFRTEEFSNVMFENERLFLELLNAPEDYKAVFVTGSGTAAMEAVVINCLSQDDYCLVVNGGTFGERFTKLLGIHNIKYDEILIARGRGLTHEDLYRFENKKYTAFLINLHETSVGTLYDLEMVSEFCERNNIMLIVDAISSFLADEIDMKKCNVDVLIAGSQKALACAPGISLIALSPRMIEKMEYIDPKCMYLNIKDALDNAKRGQTPFTPAVGTLLQINDRFKKIKKNGGVISEIQRTRDIANDFRLRIKGLPLIIASESMSNALTPLISTTNSAYSIFMTLKNEYGIWVCPNGGTLKNIIFRVGHMGNLTKDDNKLLINALSEITIGKKDINVG